MSLGQRLHKAPEKLGSEQSSQDYEATIRRLKLLSKSQTALLKAFLHGKLADAEQLVLQSVDLMSSNGKKDPRLDEIRHALMALKLKDLEVDVNSTKLTLQEELSTLRASIDNGGIIAKQGACAPPPPATTNTGSNAKDLEKIKSLEAENKTMCEQLKDIQSRLDAANDAIAKASGNAAESAKMEIQSLKKQLEDSKRDITSRDSQITEKDNTISSHLKKIDSLTKDAQTKNAADSSKEKALKADIESTKATIAQLEAKLTASTKEWESKVNAKSQELLQLGESKAQELRELEERLEAEKEEMMEAMAQEIEEVEAAKASEFEAVQQELLTSKQRYAALQSSNKGIVTQLRTLQETARVLARDYKAHKTSSRTGMVEMGQAIQTQYKPMLVGKLQGITEEIAIVTARYRREMTERKKLHNIIQELKGNIRVYMRCRPPTKKELDQFDKDI